MKIITFALAILMMAVVFLLSICVVEDDLLDLMITIFFIGCSGCMIFLYMWQRRLENANRYYLFDHVMRCIAFASIWSLGCVTIIFAGYTPVMTELSTMTIERYAIIMIGVWILPLSYVLVGMFIRIIKHNEPGINTPV